MSTGNVKIGSVDMDLKRGNRYTVVALPASSTDSSLYLINDPHNKALTSTSPLEALVKVGELALTEVGPRVGALTHGHTRDFTARRRSRTVWGSRSRHERSNR